MGHEVHVICSNRTYPKQREYKVFSDLYNKRINLSSHQENFLF
jgi:hypothetical protein